MNNYKNYFLPCNPSDRVLINSICKIGLNLDKDDVKMINFMRTCDPIIWNDELTELADVGQMKLKFNEFMKCVDELELKEHIYIILKNVSNEKFLISNEQNVKIYESQECHKNCDEEVDEILFKSVPETTPELLFVHNNISYYGNKKLIFNSMLLFKDIDPTIFSDTRQGYESGIILEGLMEEYLVKIYLDAIIKNNFDINEIKPNDILSFLKFIDQYPSTYLLIENLETPIVDYFDLNNIHMNDEIKKLCSKYQFRYMYANLIRNSTKKTII